MVLGVGVGYHPSVCYQWAAYVPALSSLCLISLAVVLSGRGTRCRTSHPGRSVPGVEDDGFEVAALPHCSRCGTVLHPIGGGYWCNWCKVAVVGV